MQWWCGVHTQKICQGNRKSSENSNKNGAKLERYNILGETERIGFANLGREKRKRRPDCIVQGSEGNGNDQKG